MFVVGTLLVFAATLSYYRAYLALRRRWRAKSPEGDEHYGGEAGFFASIGSLIAIVGISCIVNSLY